VRRILAQQKTVTAKKSGKTLKIKVQAKIIPDRIVKTY
jgi:hypothetical protein